MTTRQNQRVRNLAITDHAPRIHHHPRLRIAPLADLVPLRSALPHLALHARQAVDRIIDQLATELAFRERARLGERLEQDGGVLCCGFEADQRRRRRLCCAH